MTSSQEGLVRVRSRAASQTPQNWVFTLLSSWPGHRGVPCEQRCISYCPLVERIRKAQARHAGSSIAEAEVKRGMLMFI